MDVGVWSSCCVFILWLSFQDVLFIYLFIFIIIWWDSVWEWSHPVTKTTHQWGMDFLNKSADQSRRTCMVHAHVHNNQTPVVPDNNAHGENLQLSRVCHYWKLTPHVSPTHAPTHASTHTHTRWKLLGPVHIYGCQAAVQCVVWSV